MRWWRKKTEQKQAEKDRAPSVPPFVAAAPSVVPSGIVPLTMELPGETWYFRGRFIGGKMHLFGFIGVPNQCEHHGPMLITRNSILPPNMPLGVL